MKIIEIDITNNKRLKAFRKVLNGDNMEIAGDTATGKTTAISALWEIIEKQGDALTHGEKKGSIRVKLGDGKRAIVAERTFTAKSSSISLLLYNGEIPEKITPTDFKAMLSTLSVNPHKIMQMGPTERVRTLMAAANIEVDLEALDAQIKKREEERLAAFRRMEEIEPGEQPEFAEAVSVSGLIAEKERMDEHNRQRQSLCKAADDACDRSGEIGDQITALADKITKLQMEARELEKKRDEYDKIEREKAKEFREVPFLDVSEISERLKTIDETNKRAAVYQRHKEELARHAAAKENHLEIFRDVKALQNQKAEALESAQWPLAGLSIEDGTVLYNGCVLENLGESEQMLVTSALAVRDIEKHPLKVVRMDGIESMSKKDFDQLKKLFNDHGVQVLSTRVSRGDVEPAEIVIVDGEYKEEGGAE